MSSATPTSSLTPDLSQSSPLPPPTSDAAVATALFLTSPRPTDPFLRSHIPEQTLYRSGEAPNRMSVFGFLSSQPSPPQYSNAHARYTPPPYKAPLDIQPSPLSSHPMPPPPIYRTPSSEEGSPRPSMTEPPRYSSQVERERERQRKLNRHSIVKDQMVETSSDGEPDRVVGEGKARRKREEGDEPKGEDGCCGCFWLGRTPQ